jgi:hypothetical protein
VGLQWLALGRIARDLLLPRVHERQQRLALSLPRARLMGYARRLRRAGKDPRRRVVEGVCSFCGLAASAIRPPDMKGFRALHAAPICAEWKRLCESLGGRAEAEVMMLDEYEQVTRVCRDAEEKP